MNPRAIEFMKEVGYDLTTDGSKSLDEFNGKPITVAVTMGCGDACPLVRAERREEWDIPDPKEMPAEQYREVRDFIEWKVKELLASLRLDNGLGFQVAECRFTFSTGREQRKMRMKRSVFPTMSRFALTICFTITSLFGQGFCCCAFAKQPPEASAFANNASTSKTVKSSCCSTGETECPATPQKPQKPGDCPCKKDTSAAVFSRIETQQVPATPELSADLQFAALSLDNGYWLVQTDHQLFVDTGCGLPFLTSQDLLYGHHRLRC